MGSLKVDFTLILNLFYLKVTIMNIFNLLKVFYFHEKAHSRDTVTQMTDFIVLSLVKSFFKNPDILNLVLELKIKHGSKFRAELCSYYSPMSKSKSLIC